MSVLSIPATCGPGHVPGTSPQSEVDVWLSREVWLEYLDDHHEALEMPSAELLGCYTPLVHKLAAAGSLS